MTGETGNTLQLALNDMVNGLTDVVVDLANERRGKNMLGKLTNSRFRDTTLPPPTSRSDVTPMIPARSASKCFCSVSNRAAGPAHRRDPLPVCWASAG
jgi:hypothetical protein